LAAIVTLVATPLECDSTDAVDAAGCRARWQARFHRANESAQQDSVFELDSVVTHQSGRLADLELLRTGRRAAVGQARSIQALLDAVNRRRLEGRRQSLPPVPGSVLWLLEHATVRATPIKPPIEQIVPPPLKKRADSENASARIARA